MSTGMRRFRREAFTAAGLSAQKNGARVSVCLPALDEEATIGPIIETIRRDLVDRVALVDEILVVDDGSTDGTVERALSAGAKVVDNSEATGKGGAMWTGVLNAAGDAVVFCDADVRNFDAGFVVGLLGPLLTDPSVKFVKGYYERPYEGQPGEGGRVTELVARPLLEMLFPRLAEFEQPLAGECAAWRQVFAAVPFVEGYGVDVALLVDIAARFGVDAMVQCDLGTRVHRNRPLDELAPQATAIIRTLLNRAGIALP